MGMLYYLKRKKVNTMKKILFLFSLIVVVQFGCKKDDDDNNNNTGGGGGSSDTSISSQDRTFVLNAAMANYAEIQAGDLASTSASDSSIMAFGMMMSNDHTAAQNDLHAIADSLEVYAPDSLDSAHVALGAQLLFLTGSEFDSVYIHSQVTDHINAIHLFETEVSNGTNAVIKNYASSKLPVIQMHKDLADSLAALH
jgi:putative membrane protein